jgi:hypothetical protein
MTKLYEVDVELGWQNLNTLTGVTILGEYELWNAGREHDVINIFYTESEEEPTDESFYKTLPRQNKAIIEVGEQPIWVKSEVKSAKLIISTSTVEDVDLAGDSLTALNAIKNDIAITKNDDYPPVITMDSFRDATFKGYAFKPSYVNESGKKVSYKFEALWSEIAI